MPGTTQGDAKMKRSVPETHSRAREIVIAKKL